MAKAPAKTSLTGDSVKILNAIRGQASSYYKGMIPRATENDTSIREIGNIMMQFQPLQNEFLSALYNRIGRVIITSKMYYNPWAPFKKGLMELGETIEEVFVNIARAHTFNPEVAETEFMKREIPDVRAQFHTMNYQKFYKATISNDQLRQAFLSWQGITDLISKIVDAMYTGHNYDEFMVTKYMLARRILAGQMYGATITEPVDEQSTKEAVTQIKTISNELTYETKTYNLAGVYNFSDKQDQYIITTAKFDARMDVNVLAAAFNMDKAEFMGHRVQIDGFDRLDDERLAELFADDPSNTYTPLTADEKTALAAVPAILVDRDFFMIFDNLYKFTEDYNGQGLYWQYWLHSWKTFSTSAFANAVVFVPGTQSVTSVTVTPAAASILRGQTIQLEANVETENFAPASVVWSWEAGLSELTENDVTITQDGKVTVREGAPTDVSFYVVATSTFDSSVSGSATISVLP